LGDAMSEFEAELAENRASLETARRALLEEVRRLGVGDLERRRRGGWSIGEVLRHVADSEIAYVKVIGFIRSAHEEIENATDAEMASPEAAIGALARSRAALLRSLGGVDEDTFYELRTLGHEQYSIVSVLENVTMHDHEHREQIAKTLAT